MQKMRALIDGATGKPTTKSGHISDVNFEPVPPALVSRPAALCLHEARLLAQDPGAYTIPHMPDQPAVAQDFLRGFRIPPRRLGLGHFDTHREHSCWELNLGIRNQSIEIGGF
jgi:hypothetical protein